MGTAILFDCDGVLVDSEVLAMEVELASLAEIGLAPEPIAYRRRYLGTSAADFFAGLEAEHRGAFGTPLPDGFEARLRRRYREAFDTRLTPIPGVHAMLAGLAGPRAVASSSSVAGLTRKLDRTGLTRFFGPHVYSAEMVARGKPAPDLFLHAARGLGVDPAGCVVVEDSVNGVRAARAAGMAAIGFTGGGHCHPAHGEDLLEAGAAVVAGDMIALTELILAAPRLRLEGTGNPPGRQT